MSTHWTKNAACRGQTDLFVPSENLTPKAVVKLEKKAKRICASCPALQSCAEEHVVASHSDYPLIGVWGGMNADERRWIVQNLPSARALDEQLRSGGTDAQELREWMEAVGPADGVSPEMSYRSTADLWGYSPETVRRWYQRRKVTPKRHGNAWSEAVYDLLSSDTERWWAHTDVVRKVAQFIPMSVVEDTQRRVSRNQNRDCTFHTAASRIIYRTITFGVNSGRYEKRIEDGRFFVRMAPTEAERLEEVKPIQLPLFTLEQTGTG